MISFFQNTHRRAASDWFARRQDNRMGVDDRAGFEDWIRADTRNAREYNNLRAMDTEIDELKGFPLIEAARRKALAAGVGEQRLFVQFSPKFAWARSSIAIATAASLLILAISSTFYWDSRDQRSGVYATALGESEVRKLSDGSIVELNTNSKLSVQFTTEERRIVLDYGQVHFTVAHDFNRPFIVIAGSSSIRAIGTAFEVYKKGNDIRITLTEGRVDVERLTERNESADDALLTYWSTQLNPGEQVLVSPDLIKPEIRKVDVNRLTAWRQGNLVLDDQLLSEMVEELNRYSSDPIVIVDESLAFVRVSGVFRVGDIDTALLALNKSFGIQSRERKDGKIELFWESRVAVE